MNKLIKKIINRTKRSARRQAGMTLVELIVVLSIFAVLSTVAIFNYRDFQAKVDIKNLGSDIALKIVEAQKLSVNGVWNSSTTLANWKPSYGAYFDTATPKQFLYFADLDNNDRYDGLPTCTIECLDKITITKDNYISRIDGYTGSTITLITTPFSVVFRRPDSRAIFRDSNGALIGFDYIQITVDSPNGAKVLIKLYPSGRVQVN